jgi:hypothetical protein
MIGINSLYVGLDDPDMVLGSSVFLAWNKGRRFKIEIDWLPERDPNGRFVLTVGYQPWPRNERGRRRQDVPFEFGEDEEVVGVVETRSYTELLSELERWMDRCTTWCREGH